MTVEDEEPLTEPSQGSETGEIVVSGPSRNRPSSGGERLNSILTSALHTHAAAKLAKKLTKRKKKKGAAASEDEGGTQKESKDAKKKKKGKKFKDIDQKEELELEVIQEKPKDRKKSKRKEEKERAKEEKERAKEEKERAKEEKERAKEEKERTKEEKEEEEERAKEKDELAREENEEGDREKETKKRERKRSKQVGGEVESPTRRYLEAVSEPKKRGRKSSRNTGGVLGVTVHAADRFQGSPMLLPHPLVQVYMVDCETGCMLNKSSRDHRATSYYEAGRVDHILPIMTQPFQLSKARSVVCRWEEEIIFNESLRRFTSEDHPVIIFFQLMDFPDTAHQQGAGRQAGWLTFAWAFLKIRGANDRLNVGHRLRLQLWRPRRNSGVGMVELYSWWKSGSRTKYPSTLYVTLAEVTLPSSPAPALRSMFATQAESGGGDRGAVAMGGRGSPSSLCRPGSSIARGSEVKWGRRPHQPCQLPSHVLVRLPPSTPGMADYKSSFRHNGKGQGFMVVKFSHDGLSLACGGGQGAIRIHQIPCGTLSYILPGHLGLVYDLCWSDDDSLLLSASADATARVWPMRKEGGVQILTHPSFVYAAIFLPSGHVATCCYDHLIRVWGLQGAKKGGGYHLVQELPGHHGYVTALCLTQTADQVLSGDSQGVVMVWQVEQTGEEKHMEEPSEEKRHSRGKKVLRHERRVVVNEEGGAPINALVAIPGGSRILIHSRDSQLRLVCGRTWAVTQRLGGAINVTQQLRGCVTPCGTWIMAGSEDGTLHAWHADTGHSAIPLPDILPGPISCVDYHPHDHLAALTSCTPDAPVMLVGPQNLPLGDPHAFVSSPSIAGVIGSPGNSVIADLTYQQISGSPVPLHSTPLTRTTPSPSLPHSDASHLLGQSQGTSHHLVQLGGTYQKLSQSEGTHQQVIQSESTYQHLSQFQDTYQQSQFIQHLDQSHGQSQHSSRSLFSETLVRDRSENMRSHHHQRDSVLRKLDDVLKMVTTQPLTNSTNRLSSTVSTPIPPPLHQRKKKTSKSKKVIAVPSSSGGVSFLSEPEVTPSKARARRHKVTDQVT